MSFRNFKYGWQMPYVGLEDISKSLLQNTLLQKDICIQDSAIEICLSVCFSLFKSGSQWWASAVCGVVCDGVWCKNRNPGDFILVLFLMRKQDSQTSWPFVHSQRVIQQLSMGDVRLCAVHWFWNNYTFLVWISECCYVLLRNTVSYFT